MTQAANKWTEGMIVPEEQAPVKESHSTSALMVTTDENEYDPEIADRNVGDLTLKNDAAASDSNKTRRGRIAFIGILSLAIIVIVIVAVVVAITTANKNKNSNAEVANGAPFMPPSPIPSVLPSTLPTIAPSLAPTMSTFPPTTSSANPTSAPTNPTIWNAVGGGFDVTKTLKISSSATALNSNGDVIAIGSVDNTKNSTFQGQVNVWVLKNSTSAAGTELTWSPLGQPLEGTEPNDNFGVSVALSANGRMLAVGATQLSDVYGSAATGGGYVQVYSIEGTTWLPRGAPVRAPVNSSDAFGYEVALSEDGMVLAVLAANYYAGIDVPSAYAQIFHYNETGDAWKLFDTIQRTKTSGDLHMDLSGDGHVLALGDTHDGILGTVSAWDCDPASSTGCAKMGQDIVGADYEDYTGTTLSLSYSGDILAVGAPGSYDCAYGPTPCANVKVFGYGRHSEAVWSQIGQELTGQLGFGRNVKLSTDGTLLAVDVSVCYLEGGCDYSYEDLSYVSQVYSLKSVDGSGVWIPVGNPANGTLLDFSLDGSMVAVHDGGEGGDESVVTAYKLSTVTSSASPTSAPARPTIWNAVGGEFDVPKTLKISSSATALNSNGDVIAIGSVDNTKNSTFQGQVNVWVLKNSTSAAGTELTWSPLGQPLEGTEPNDNFGVSVALSANGRMLAVGATQLSDVYGSAATGGGYVQVYSIEGTTWLPRGAPVRAPVNSSDAFGYEVALSEDGMVLAVLAANYYAGIDVPSAYAQIFHYNETGDAWKLFDTIQRTKTRGDLHMDLSGDGHVLALGDTHDGILGTVSAWDCNPASSTGCAKMGQDIFGVDYEDYTGTTLSLSYSGDILAVGAPGSYDCAYEPTPCANVKVFGYGRHSEAVWSQIGQELTGQLGFGRNVKLSTDGTLLAVDVSVCYLEGGCDYSDEDLSYVTQVYSLKSMDGSGVWMPIGKPANGTLLDLSSDESTVAVQGGQGDVVTTYQRIG